MGGGSTKRDHQETKTYQTNTDKVTGIDSYQRLFDKNYQNLGNLWASRISQPMNLQYFQGFSDNLGPIVQNTMARGVQNLKASESAANQELANRLSVAGTGDNSSLLAALQRQSQIVNAGNANALIPQALEQQRNFDVQRQQLTDASNQLKLAERGQYIQELNPGLNLLESLNRMASTSAGRKTTQTGSSIQDSKSKTRKSYV